MRIDAAFEAAAAAAAGCFWDACCVCLLGLVGCDRANIMLQPQEHSITQCKGHAELGLIYYRMIVNVAQLSVTFTLCNEMLLWLQAGMLGACVVHIMCAAGAC